MLHCEVSKIYRLRFNRFSVTQFPPLSQRKLIYQCYLKRALLENSVSKSLIARVSRLASNSQWTSHTDYIPKITWSIYSLTLGPTEGSKIKRNSSGQSSFVTWQFSSCEVNCITESISHSPSLPSPHPSSAWTSFFFFTFAWPPGNFILGFKVIDFPKKALDFLHNISKQRLNFAFLFPLQ